MENKENKPERKENEFIGKSLTPDGWCDVRWRGGEEVTLDPADGVLPDINKKFRDKHRQAMSAFFWAISELKEKKRKVPVLREELERLGITKQIVKDLESFGLVEQKLVDLHKLGSRCVVIPTSGGRTLMRTIESAVKEAVDAGQI
jgi:hypothetical protein